VRKAKDLSPERFLKFFGDTGVEVGLDISQGLVEDTVIGFVEKILIAGRDT